MRLILLVLMHVMVTGYVLGEGNPKQHDFSLLPGDKWPHLISEDFTLDAADGEVAVQGGTSLQRVHYSQ